MIRRSEASIPAAAAVMVLIAVLGGGFAPWQRMVVGVGLIVVWIVAAVEWRGRLERSELFASGLIFWGGVSAALVAAARLASKETIVAWVVAWALWVVSRRGGGLWLALGSRIVVFGAAAVAGSILLSAVSAMTVRSAGAFENPNIAAAFLVPVLPLGSFVFRARPRLGWGWVSLVSAAVVLTGSRAGLLAALVAAAMLLPRGRVRFLGVLIGAGAAAIALAWRFVSQPDLLAWHRISIWWAVLKIWATRPLTGVGPGCLVEAAGPERILHPDQVGRFQFVIGFSESTPLAILVQVGLVGCILAGLAAASWQLRARQSGTLDSAAVRAGLASAATLSLFHDFLTVEPVLWWWAVVVGILEAVVRPSSESTAPGVAKAPAAGVRLAGGLVMIWLTAWGLLSPALARWVSSRAPITPSTLDRVARIEPWYPEPAAVRIRDLLARSERWSWETAAEGLIWARFAVGVQPGLARRWADLGRVQTRVLTDLGGTDFDVEAARNALERACELDPHLPWNWLERARLERVLGFPRQALSFVRIALTEEPNTVRGWLMLSRLELEQGRVTEAREALGEARARADLAGRAGLTAYEDELLALPEDQVEDLERSLVGTRTPRF